MIVLRDVYPACRNSKPCFCLEHVVLLWSLYSQKEKLLREVYDTLGLKLDCFQRAVQGPPPIMWVALTTASIEGQLCLLQVITIINLLIRVSLIKCLLCAKHSAKTIYT